MTWKEHHASTLNPLLPLRKKMIGKLRSHRDASVPVTIDHEGARGEESISPAPEPGRMERTMEGKET